MAMTAFDCVFLVILMTGLFQLESAIILGDTPPGIQTNPKDEVEYILKLVTVIHSRQTAIDHYLNFLNSTLFNMDHEIKILNSEILLLAPNITDLKSESSYLKNELKMLNQTVLNLTHDLKSTTTNVTQLKTQVSGLDTKTTDLETKFKHLNSTLTSFETQNSHELEKLKNNITDEVTSLKAETRQLKSDITELRHNVTILNHPSAPSGSLPADVNATKANIEKLKEENKIIRAEAANLMQEIIDVKADIKVIQGHHQREIMFMAMFDGDRFVLDSNTPLLFDIASLNVGHGYDKSSGKFTAPIAGVYMFFLQIQSRIKGIVYAAILKNGQEVAEIYSAMDDERHDETGSTHVMLSLKSGDEIWATRKGRAEDYYGGFRSHFTGFLMPNQ